MFDDEDDKSIHGLLHEVMIQMRNGSIKAFRKYELNPGQARILFALQKQGDLSQRELAKIICVTPPSITVALQKMEKQGYLKRRQDEHDQRIIRLEITDKGSGCVADIKSVTEGLEQTLTKGINTEERLLLRRLLIQIRDNMTEVAGDEACWPHFHAHD